MRIYGKRPSDPRTKYVRFNGERRSLLGWANKLGLTYLCVWTRVRRGVALDKPKSGRGGRRSYESGKEG